MDTPYVVYNDVKYDLHKTHGNLFESERMTLVSTSTRITLHIGDFKQTDQLDISTGAQENDLFGF